MSVPGVTLSTGLPAVTIGGGFSLKAVFNFGSRQELLTECDKICEKVEKIHRIVADQANYIHPCAMALFLDFVNRFVEERMVYYARRNAQGPFSFFNTQPKKRAENLIELGTAAYREGVAVSTSGTSTRSYCRLYHRDPPKNSEGRCLLCFADLPLLEPKQGTGAFLTWEAYLNSFPKEDILTIMNQVTEGSSATEELSATGGSPAAEGLSATGGSPAAEGLLPVTEGSKTTPPSDNPLGTGRMIKVEDSSTSYLGLEKVSESEIPSMWQTFSAVFTPKRSRGDTVGQ